MAVGSEISIAKILADLNLAVPVWDPHDYKKFWQILVWQL